MQPATQQCAQRSLRFYLELLLARRLRPAWEPEQVLLREWWRPEPLQQVSAAQERVPLWVGKGQLLLRPQEWDWAAAQQALPQAERAPAGQSLVIATCIMCVQRLALTLHISADTCEPMQPCAKL